MKNYILYGHGGSYNHGAEASVKCDIELLRKKCPGSKIILSTHFPEWDERFCIQADEIIGRNVEGSCPEEMYEETINRITSESICLSVGGDNYCYQNWQRYAAIHNVALLKGAKSILWSCSLEPEMIDKEMLSCLRSHHAIVARESVTIKALEERGLQNVIWMPDVAFLLKEKNTEIPIKNYIVINLSPLVIRRNPDVLPAYQQLVDKIIKNTDYNIALVPHVEVSVDNDYEALEKLEVPSERVFRVPVGLSAAEYKYIISKAECCVASRTHATVAAWSSLVPTIAVGYSAKAIGISRDLGQEGYLVDINHISGKLLCDKLTKLLSEKEKIRKGLAPVVSEWVERINLVTEELFG